MIQCEVCHWTAWAVDIATILGAGATIAAVWVAIVYGRKAYNVWKDQLTGTTKYELALKALKSVYVLRENVRLLRHPIRLLDYELTDETKAEFDIPEVNYSFPPIENELEYLKENMDNVCGALAETRLMEYEAEALFHPAVKETLVEIRQFVVYLHFRYAQYTSALWEAESYPPNEWPRELELRISSEYRKLYKEPIDEGSELETLIMELERELERYCPTE
jgi:hypothetical protein